MASRKQVLRGATKPRIQSVPIKGKSKVADVIEIAKLIGEELLPYQEYVLKDMLTVDKKDMWVRKSSLLLISRQNGKTFLAPYAHIDPSA
jgi:phage terminase large subunit-like protein